MVDMLTIPDDILVPLFYAEFDNSQAAGTEQDLKAVIVGQMLAGGTAVPGMAYNVPLTDAAIQLFGEGSMLARMHKTYRDGDPMGEVWMIGLEDDPEAEKAVGAFTISGTASKAGTLNFYIAGDRVRIGVGVGDEAADIAADVVAAINATPTLPVTAAIDAGVAGKVKITCRWAGETGNDITLFLNRRGALGGEVWPSGLNVTITKMADGLINPDIGAAILAMGDESYDHIIMPYTDSATLDAWQEELNAETGRWSYARQLYGHVWTARRGTFMELQSFGASRNDGAVTVYGFEPKVPMPCWLACAAWGAREAVSLKNFVSKPTQTLTLIGIDPADRGERFLLQERQLLLRYGIATANVGGGVLRIERAVTTYQKNAFDQRDISWRDSETRFQLVHFTRFMKSSIVAKYGAHALADNGTNFGKGKDIVTPDLITLEMIARYGDLEEAGVVEDMAGFKKKLIIERELNGIKALVSPNVVNQFRTFKMRNQFIL